MNVMSALGSKRKSLGPKKNNATILVIPAQAGIQKFSGSTLDPRLRGDDDPRHSSPSAQLAQRLFILLLMLSTIVASSARAASPAPPAAGQTYVFGSFPFLAQADLEGIFTPLIAEISTALGRPIRYETAANVDLFNQILEQQRFDIAHIQPFDYVGTAVAAGYVPLVTRMEPLSAVFVVNPDSPLRKAADLRGRTLGLPPRRAASSLLSQVTLLKEGLDMDMDMTLKIFSTHQACLQQLLIGDIDACSVGKPVVRFFEAEIGRTFRVILTTPDITQTLFVVHKRVPVAERELIQKALIDSRLANVAPNLRKLFLPSAEDGGAYFRPVTDKEYDNVRQYLKILKAK